MERKIPYILPCHYNIDSMRKYCLFLKNGIKRARSFAMNFNDGREISETLDAQVQQYLFKALRKTRAIEKLDLSYAMHKKSSNNPMLVKLAKDQSRVKSIKFAMPKARNEIIVKDLIGWLKYPKNLKRLDWKELQRVFYFSFGLSSRKELSEIDKKLLSVIRYHRLINWRLCSKGAYENNPKTIFLFRKYPQTLEKLDINIHTFSSAYRVDDKLNIDFSPLKNLRHLSVSISDVPHLWKLFFESIGQIKQLETLQLQMNCPGLDLTTITNWGENLSSLKHVKLQFENSIELETILANVCKPDLKTYYISMVKNACDLSIVQKYLEPMTQLESLTLKLLNDWTKPNSTIFVEEITKHISKLSLKKLNLGLTQTLPRDRRKKLPAPVSLSGKLLLANSVKLEELKIIGNHLNSENFPEFLRECGKLDKTLRKVNINTGEFTPSKVFLQEICGLVKSFEMIQILKLPKLVIENSLAFERVIDSVLDLKHLRKFKLGNLEKAVTHHVLISRLYDILSVPGLELFSAAVNSRMRFKSNESRESYLEALKWSRIRNPSLDVLKIFLDYIIPLRFSYLWMNDVLR